MACAMIAAIPEIQKSPLFRSPQTVLLACLTFVVVFSVAASGWLGGTLNAATLFVPGAIVAPLILIAVSSAGKLRALIFALTCVAIFIVLHGARDYYAIQPYIPYLAKQDIIENVSPYLTPQAIGENDWIFRTRGLDFLNDPNDLAQFLISLLPLLFFSWKRKKTLRNILLVYVPGAIFIFGMFLTHSRSGMLAMIAVVLFSARKKVGNTWALGLCIALVPRRHGHGVDRRPRCRHGRRPGPLRGLGRRLHAAQSPSPVRRRLRSIHRLQLPHRP